MPTVSIIILNFNGKHLLSMPLDSIKKLHYPKNNIEVIIVDNGSSDGSLAYLKNKSVRVVPLATNEGYSALNHGVAVAKGEFLFLLNNDLSLDPDCITELVHAYHSHKNVGLLAPLIVDAKFRFMATRYVSRSYYCGGKMIKYRKKQLPPVQDAAFVGLIFFHRSLVKKLGGRVWDPDYFLYAEDLDVGLRTLMLGLSVKQVNTALVSHVWDGTISKYFSSPKRAFLAERNLLVTYVKDADSRSLILYLPFVVSFRVLSLFQQVILLHGSIAWAKIRAYWFVVANLKYLLKKRRAVQILRKVPDSTFFPQACSERQLFEGAFAGLFKRK